MNRPTTKISINSKGSATGKSYKGSFEVRLHLSLVDLADADLFRRNLIGPNPEHALDSTKQLAFIAGQLAVRIQESPDWWNVSDTGLGGEKMADMNIPREILSLVEAEIQKYNESLQKAADKATSKIRKQLEDDQK